MTRSRGGGGGGGNGAGSLIFVFALAAVMIGGSAAVWLAGAAGGILAAPARWCWTRRRRRASWRAYRATSATPPRRGRPAAAPTCPAAPG